MLLPCAVAPSCRFAAADISACDSGHSCTMATRPASDSLMVGTVRKCVEQSLQAWLLRPRNQHIRCHQHPACRQFLIPPTH